MAKRGGTTRVSSSSNPNGLSSNNLSTGGVINPYLMPSNFSRRSPRYYGMDGDDAARLAQKLDGLTQFESEQVMKIYDGFTIQSSSYSNPDLMEIRETSMGNWRLFYAGSDTGTTMSKSIISKYIARKAGLLK